jgi:hypothetical protein
VRFDSVNSLDSTSGKIILFTCHMAFVNSFSQVTHCAIIVRIQFFYSDLPPVGIMFHSNFPTKIIPASPMQNLIIADRLLPKFVSDETSGNSQTSQRKKGNDDDSDQ